MRIFAAGASGATGTYVEVRILSTKKVSGKTLWYCICGRYGMYSPRTWPWLVQPCSTTVAATCGTDFTYVGPHARPEKK